MSNIKYRIHFVFSYSLLPFILSTFAAVKKRSKPRVKLLLKLCARCARTQCGIQACLNANAVGCWEKRPKDPTVMSFAVAVFRGVLAQMQKPLLVVVWVPRLLSPPFLPPLLPLLCVPTIYTNERESKRAGQYSVVTYYSRLTDVSATKYSAMNKSLPYAISAIRTNQCFFDCWHLFSESQKSKD